MECQTQIKRARELRLQHEVAHLKDGLVHRVLRARKALLQ